MCGGPVLCQRFFLEKKRQKRMASQKATWEWAGDGGAWHPFSVDLQPAIEAGSSTGAEVDVGSGRKVSAK